MGGVCVYVCVHALRWEGGSVGESQPASFFQDMGKKGGGIAPLIPAQRGQDPVRQGGAATQTSLLGTVPAPGGRMGREQVLCFSRQAVSMKPSPRGRRGCSPPAHSHTHPRTCSCTRPLFTTPTPQGGNQIPWPSGARGGSHLCQEGFELVISPGPFCPDMLVLTFSNTHDGKATATQDHPHSHRPPPAPPQARKRRDTQTQTD